MVSALISTFRRLPRSALVSLNVEPLAPPTYSQLPPSAAQRIQRRTKVVEAVFQAPAVDTSVSPTYAEPMSVAGESCFGSSERIVFVWPPHSSVVAPWTLRPITATHSLPSTSASRIVYVIAVAPGISSQTAALQTDHWNVVETSAAGLNSHCLARATSPGCGWPPSPGRSMPTLAFDCWLAPGSGPGAMAVVPVIALSASLRPNVGKSLEPVTWTCQRAPIEPAGTTNVFSVAPSTSLQVAQGPGAALPLVLELDRRGARPRAGVGGQHLADRRRARR